MPSVDDSIQFVKGIGPKKAKLLEKLHIRTLRDALETYPRDYEDRTHHADCGNRYGGQVCCARCGRHRTQGQPYP